MPTLGLLLSVNIQPNCLSSIALSIKLKINSCSVFRKDSFSGLGTSFFSNCTFRFKLNGISTLLARAYRLCSTFSFLHDEFEFLKVVFRSNGFCTSFIENQIKKFLNKKMMGSILNNTSVDE